MSLSEPKVVTWWVGVALGVLGLLGHFVKLPFVSAYDFWFVFLGFLVLVLGTYLKDL